MAIGDGDGGKGTSDESPRRSREIANVHTWPVRVRIAKLEEANGSPPKPALLGRGSSQLKPTRGVEDELVRRG